MAMTGIFSLHHSAILCSLSQRIRTLLSCALFLAVIGGGDAAAAGTSAPEMGFDGKVRAAREIHTDELMQLLKEVILIDVSDASAQPGGLSTVAATPSPHLDIAGSIWMPGVGGGGALNIKQTNSFIRRLESLTNDDPGQPLVFYGHANGKNSLTAATRAINLGYLNVYWYPDGMEGWRKAGQTLAAPKVEMKAEDATNF